MQFEHVECIFDTYLVDIIFEECFTIMDPIFMALTTLLPSKCIFQEALTSYVSNMVVFKMMCLEAPESWST